MTSFEVFNKLRDAGYTAHYILRALREESETAVTRPKGHRLERAQAAVRELGVSPESIDYSDAGRAWR